MDLDKSLEDQFELNMLCIPMGETSLEFFYRIIEILNKSVRSTALLPFWQQNIKEKTKAVMPYRDWGSRNNSSQFL